MTTPADISIDREVLDGFVAESLEALDAIDPLFVRLETESTNIELVNAIFRPIHSIKGNAPFFGLLTLKNLAHELESVLALVRSSKLGIDKNLINLELEGVDELKTILRLISEGESDNKREATAQQLIEKCQKFCSAPKTSSSAAIGKIALGLKRLQSGANKEQQAQISEMLQIITSCTDGSAAGPSEMEAAKQAAPEKSAPVPAVTPAEKDKVHEDKHSAQKSMRVSEERIDTFLAFVGELIVVGEMLRHLTLRIDIAEVDPTIRRDFNALEELFNGLSTSLERAIMSIRKVPIKQLTQRMPRIVRDIADKEGKQIEVVITGDDLEVDKSLLELLDAPLMHMVRNAADHGIENPALRQSSGKSSKGTIALTCKEHEKFFVIEVRDDGAGLNLPALQRKAESLGLISAGSKLSMPEIVNLLFMAGVSTASQVSDISGRGVGMDVVKRNIEHAGGSIEVSFEPNIGSCFTIRLPTKVTTQIFQGFVIEVEGAFFVFPLDCVHETWYLPQEQIGMVFERGAHVNRHGNILRLIDIGTLLGLRKAMPTKDDTLVVAVNIGGELTAVVVDRIVGVRQLVVKPLNELVNRKRTFAGGAFLGDGSVALVLDLTKFREILRLNSASLASRAIEKNAASTQTSVKVPIVTGIKIAQKDDSAKRIEESLSVEVHA